VEKPPLAGRKGESHSGEVTAAGVRSIAGRKDAERANARVTLSAANPAPKAKRITGPKLFAAATPTKYIPGTDDSKLEERIGEPWMALSDERIAGLRKASRSTSTL